MKTFLLFFFMCVGNSLLAQYLVKDINQGEASSVDVDYLYKRPTTVFNNHFYFAASDGLHGRELWKSDGTESGTQMVKDVAEEEFSDIENLTPTNNFLYYTASKSYLKSLWRTDGTENGTVLMKDSVVAKPFVINNELFFFRQIPNLDVQLWKINGTGQVINMVMTLPRVMPYTLSAPDLVTKFKNYYVFKYRDHSDLSQPALWRTDGTVAGTKKIIDLNIRDIWTSDAGIFLRANYGDVWFSNGTTAGSRLIASGTLLNEGALYRNQFFYAKYVSNFNHTLVRVDSLGNENFVRSLNQPIMSFDEMNGELYFNSAYKLFKVNASYTSTELLQGNVGPLIGNDGNTLYFQYYRDIGFMEIELGGTNGTVNNVWRKDIFGKIQGVNDYSEIEGLYSSRPKQVTKLGTRIFFFAFTLKTGAELFTMKSNCTSLPNPPTITSTPALQQDTVYISPRQEVTFTASNCSGKVTWADGKVSTTNVTKPYAFDSYWANCTDAQGCTSNNTNEIQVRYKIDYPKFVVLNASSQDYSFTGEKLVNSSIEDTVKVLINGCKGGIVKWSDGYIGVNRDFSFTQAQEYRYRAFCEYQGGNYVTELALVFNVADDIAQAQLSTSQTTIPFLYYDEPTDSYTGVNLYNYFTVTGCDSYYYSLIINDRLPDGTFDPFPQPGIYTISAKCGELSSGFGKKSNSIQIQVVNPIVTTPNRRTRICLGQSVNLVASSSVCVSDFKWSWNGIETTGTTVSASPTESTGYYFSCRDNSNNTFVKKVDVYVETENYDFRLQMVPVVRSHQVGVPKITLAGINCVGGTVRWFNGHIGDTLTTAAPTPSQQTYSAYCRISICGKTDSTYKSITTGGSSASDVAPTIINNRSVYCYGETIDLSVTGGSCPQTLRTWYRNGRATGGGSLEAISVKENMVIHVGCGFAISAPITVTVTQPLKMPSASASAGTVAQGGSVTLTASGCSGATVRWSDGGTGSSRSVTLTATKSFSAWCNNACQITLPSNIVTVIVNATQNQPTIPVVTSNKSLICYGEIATISASNCNGIVQWDNGFIGNTISYQNTPSISTFKARCLLNGGTSAYSDEVQVSVIQLLPLPVMEVSPEGALYTGQSKTLSVNNCPASVVWNDGFIGVTRSVSPTVSTIYSVRCTNNFCTESNISKVLVKVLINPCPSAIQANELQAIYDSGITLKKASGSISAANIVHGNAKVTYQGGTYVLLSPGFSVSNGAMFVAQMGGCN